jgi:hypothetical protein
MNGPAADNPNGLLAAAGPFQNLALGPRARSSPADALVRIEVFPQALLENHQSIMKS